MRRWFAQLSSVALVAGLALGVRGAAGATAAPVSQIVPDSRLAGPGAFMGPVRTVAANGIRIGYRQFGHGPDLLMVTGDSAPMSYWMPYLTKPLSRSFRVTIFDNRGVGYSTDDPAVPLSVPLMARDTAGLMDALGLRDTTVVGWSMGGEIAITMAALHLGTDRLGRIVSSGGDAGSRHSIPFPSRMIAELADPTGSVGAELRLMFPRTVAGDVGSADFLAAYLAVPQETVSQQILKRQETAESDFLKIDEVWNHLRDVHVPALITNGQLDPGQAPANASRLAQVIPGARLSIYDGAAHGMMFQDAERFAAQVSHFAKATTHGH